jgi:hypothetical protein
LNSPFDKSIKVIGDIMKRSLYLSLVVAFLLMINSYAQDEPQICKYLFGSSDEVTRLATDAISLAVDAVWESNGKTTGTLTQSSVDSDLWTYSSNPTDKLVLIFNYGVRVEFIFYMITGYVNGTAEDFKWSHNMDFNTFVANRINLRINSSTYPQSGKVYWQRSITGSTLYDSQNMNVNIQHTGNIEYDIGSNISLYYYREQATGSSVTGSFSVNIDEKYYRFIGNDRNLSKFVINTQIINNSSGNFSGTTYQYQNAKVFWAAGSIIYGGYYNKVINSSEWEASGALLKNGQTYGSVQFDGPVIDGTYGPDLILRLINGSNILLHKLIEITPTGINNDELPGESGFTIYQNYPNPFNSSTSIQYKVSSSRIISMVIYDVIGREVETLINNQEMGSGIYEMKWDARDLPGGVYFCRININSAGKKSNIYTLKMILLK